MALCAAMRQSALRKYEDKDELEMTMANVEAHPTTPICKEHKLFEGHSAMRLGVMLAKTREVNMRPGQELFRADDKGTSLFILLSGELACITRDNKEVKVLQAGMLASLPLVWVRTWLP